MLYPFVAGIGTNSLPFLQYEHNGLDVAASICFLYPVAYNIPLGTLLQASNMPQTAVLIGPLSQSEVHACQEQEKEQSLEPHGVTAAVWSAARTGQNAKQVKLSLFNTSSTSST